MGDSDRPKIRRFDAALRGEPRRWRGRVTARFRRAVLVAPAAGEGLARALVDASLPLSPGSVAVPWQAGAPPTGSAVHFDGGTLLFAGGAEGGDRVVELVGVGVTLTLDPVPSSERHGPDRPWLERQRAWIDPPASTRALLGDPAAQPADSAGRALADRLAPALAALADALVGSAGVPHDVSLASLIGLGPGSTPSGDDAIVGALAAARRCLPGEAARGRLRRVGAAAALRARRSTTPLAGAMIGHAARGRFAEPLRALVLALGDPRVEARHLDARVDGLCARGGRSGADQLAGVLAVIDAARRTEGTTG